MQPVQSQPVRVAVHASDVFTHVGLIRYLETLPEIRVLPSDRREEADVVVLAPARLDPRALAELRAQARTDGQVTVLIADGVTESDLIVAAECRVVAVLPRQAATGDRLASHVLAAAARRGMSSPLLPGELARDLDQLRRSEAAQPGQGTVELTDREVEVLRLMSEGWDTAEIAEKLCYSQRTVKNIIYRLTTRLRLRNRSHAVAYAMRTGVI